MAQLEGFLCPLCKADCRSVQELERHYREEHESSRRATKLINNFKNFVDMAKTSLKGETSPKPGAREVKEASSSVERSTSLASEGPVTNVSGISTELWEPQQTGESGWSQSISTHGGGSNCTLLFKRTDSNVGFTHVSQQENDDSFPYQVLLLLLLF